MPYQDRYQHADDVIAHLDQVVPPIQDTLLKAKYVGFVAVASVTVYELAIKDIFCEFGVKKHPVFGCFTESHFARINGRIKLASLKNEHIPKFGDKYLKRFQKYLNADAVEQLRLCKRDICSAYNNLIVCRHNFAHKGEIATNMTYEEAVQAYEDGKKVLACLARTMVR